MVIVDLNWNVTENELRTLTRALWVVQVGPIVARLNGQKKRAAAWRGHAQARQLCQRLITNGFLSLITPLRTAESKTPAGLLYAVELGAIAQDLWREDNGGWRVNVDEDSFLPQWEMLRPLASEVLLR